MNNKMKKFATRMSIAGVLSTLALSFVIPSSALAATNPDVQKCSATDVQCVIGKGDKEIIASQNALNKVLESAKKYQGNHHITDGEFNTIQKDVNDHLQKLAVLKTKLDKETTVKDAQEDVKGVRQLRVHVVVVSRDARVLHLDVEKNLDSRLKADEPKVQGEIGTAKANGPKLKELFNDLKAKVDEAQEQINQAQGKVSDLTAANFNGNKADYKKNFESFKQSEKKAHEDLNQAAKDLHQISQLLKSK